MRSKQWLKNNFGKHEIYRARVGANDDITRIMWESLTKNSSVRNLRPVIVSGHGYRVLLWLRGSFVTYTNYRLDVVGLVQDLHTTVSSIP
jgi:hypothetical protein